MHTVFVTSEIAPITGDSARGRLCASLAKVMSRAEHHVTVLCPLLGCVDANRLGLARRLTKLSFDLHERQWACEVYTGRLPTGVHLTFIGNEEVLLPAQDFEEGNEGAVALRAAVFSAAASQMLKVNDAEADLVHGIDWLGAAVITKLAADNVSLPTVLTVHDADAVGRFSAGDDHGFGPAAMSNGALTLMDAGIGAATRVTTLSANYLNRITEPSRKHPLGATLQAHRANLVAIRDGIDPATWNPLTDQHLPARFDPVDRSGKATCKAELQKALTLPVSKDVPLIAAIGRVEGDQMDLLSKVAPDILKNDVQLAVQLEGDGELVGIYEELWDQFPERIQIRTGADPAFRHQLIAAADLLLVPGREAPTESIQLCAMRYGALPIVHRDGGLADEVIDCDPGLKSGTGFLYDAPTHEALLACVRRATSAYANGPAFKAAQGRVMKRDHGWERTGRRYDRVYQDVTAA